MSRSEHACDGKIGAEIGVPRAVRPPALLELSALTGGPKMPDPTDPGPVVQALLIMASELATAGIDGDVDIHEAEAGMVNLLDIAATLLPDAGVS